MDSRERVRKALRFEAPDRAPRDLWALPSIKWFRPDDLREVLTRFPPDIVVPVELNTDPVASGALAPGSERSLLFHYGRAERAGGQASAKGSYVDEWGCPWTVGEDGVMGEVKHPPLSDWSTLPAFQPPWEFLDGANWEGVNRLCAQSERFFITPWGVMPSDRMQWIRGAENYYLDLAWGTGEIFRLRDMVHDFFLNEIERWCKTDIDGIRIADDWGAQDRLLVSPEMWREYFKPLYVDYVRLIKGAGKFAFMHCDGFIPEIIPDFIEIGFDALNCQLFCMDIEALGEAFQGQITFWGELDRQCILPFGTVDEVRASVRRVRRALDRGKGGVIAQLEWGKDMPTENVIAAYEAWM